MASVYVVQHAYERADGEDEVKLVGVYSTQAAAEAAVARLRRQPGFADTPAGFHVEEYRVDQDQWAEGYVTVRHAG